MAVEAASLRVYVGRRVDQALEQGAGEAVLVGQGGPDDGAELVRVPGHHEAATGGEDPAQSDHCLWLRGLARLVNEHVLEVIPGELGADQLAGSDQGGDDDAVLRQRLEVGELVPPGPEVAEHPHAVGDVLHGAAVGDQPHHLLPGHVVAQPHGQQVRGGVAGGADQDVGPGAGGSAATPA